MANNAKSSKKNTIIGICAAVIVVALIVVAIVLSAKGAVIDDNYFVSDGAKYVLTEEGGTPAGDDIVPLRTHYVYYYSGDRITGLKAFYEYADADQAKIALDLLSRERSEEYKSIAQNGKYVVLEANPSDYESITATDVKNEIELRESIKGIDIEDNATAEPVETDTSEETIIEEIPADDTEANSAE